MDHRLKKNKQFSYIYKKGQRKYTKFLTLFVIQSKYKDYKIGFSVNKKIGKANVRNKVKRRLREIVRLGEFPKNYNNYVLLAKEGIDSLTYDELYDEVSKVFSK
ncbi:MAG: ribonuclease P protein component [Clostridia bacterium]|nr:ribonuclease P protein component [Clostridia bacterium]